MNRLLIRLVAGCVAASVVVGASIGRAQEVTASIHVPPAEVYVLGDDIPLVWRFTNRSTDPLAMLWEGCCRLNGKLSITADGQPVEVLPPGASSFHTYSKAETLPPGKPMEFRSLLADWVRLPAGGTLDLSGSYTGVLTNQRPQVPGGLGLWTGTATATPTRLAVASVDDYLAQRPAREHARGLALELTGPDRLPPLAPARFTLAIRNPGDADQTLDWPGTFQLWLVDERGWRLEKGSKHVPAGGEHLTVPPRGELQREFTLNSADLGGAPFGVIQVFVDLAAATPDERRLPSTAVRMNWSLGPAETAKLLNEAASGPAAGLRNPALKLLRQYLAQLPANLAAVPEADLGTVRARSLRDELRLAGCIQPLSSKPGLVFVPLRSGTNGLWTVGLPGPPCEALDGMDATSQVAKVASVRRHLGWDVTPEIDPRASTTLGEIFGLARSLAPQQPQLAAPLTWRITQSDGLATNLVQFPGGFPNGNLLIRVERTDAGVRVEAARKPAAPGQPVWMNQLTVADARTLPGTRLIDAAALKAWLTSTPVAVQPVVVADERITCGELRAWLQPVIDASVRMAVIARAVGP